MGPLDGVRVVEMAGLGAAPFGCMLLADMGADVVRIDRPAPSREADAHERERLSADPRRYATNRGRRSVAIDLNSDAGRGAVRGLVTKADVLVEGFRPGVMERLGLGPDACLADNPKLVYARMTGWGQQGPLSQTAGHDITYTAIAGALDNFRRVGDRPLPPLNLVGDMGGGGLLMAFGVAVALFEAQRSGCGQVVDAAMLDGAAIQLVSVMSWVAQGRWGSEPGANFADTGAPYYEVYETADGKYVAVGALETPFYEALLDGLGLDAADLPGRDDEGQWPAGKEVFAQIFRSKTRAEWERIFDGTDACVAPVLSMAESPKHPQSVARSVYVERGGVVQPAPAPRFSRTPVELPGPPPVVGEHTREVFLDWDVTPP